MSLGLTAFATGALLRLLLAPLGFLEGRSRFLRNRCAELEAARGEPLAAAVGALRSSLEVRRLWELAGAAVTLLLLLPAYRVLTDDAAALAGERFLWVADLSRTDLALSFVLALLVLAKLRVASPRPAGRRERLVGALLVVGFAAVLLLVPSVVLLYAAGVLLVTTAQELAARGAGERDRKSVV